MESALKEVYGYPKLLASPDGIIYWNNKGVLTPKVARPKKEGTYVMSLEYDKKSVNLTVARLIANTFLGRPPVGQNNVYHKDGDKSNNSADNLFYASQNLSLPPFTGNEQDLRVIEKCTNYLISKEGNVFWKTPEGIFHKSVRENTGGYLELKVNIGGTQKGLTVHRLVAHAFLGPQPEDKPMVCHKDGNRLNNHVDNLYYGDVNSNATDASNHGVRAVKLTPEQVLEIRERKHRKTALAKMYGVNVNTIRSIWKRETWDHVK